MSNLEAVIRRDMGEQLRVKDEEIGRMDEQLRAKDDQLRAKDETIENQARELAELRAKVRNTD